MKTRTLVITIVLACGGLFVLLITVVAGVAFLMYRNADATVTPKIDTLFAAIDNGAFGKTYLTETTPEFREAVSQEQYEQIGLAVRARLGSLQSKTLTQFNARLFNTDSYIDVVYSASFEKGSGTIRAQFKSIHGEWRVVSFFVDSPEFLKDMAAKKCPHCGEPNSAAAKFCANCGKALPDRDTTKLPTTNGKSNANDPAAQGATDNASQQSRDANR